MATQEQGTLLWEPPDELVERATLTRYMRWLESERGLSFDDYDALWRWSTEEVEASRFRARDERRMIVAPGECVLRVIQLGAREPRRARHRFARERRAVRVLRATLEEFPHRRPEGVEISDRPAPELLVRREPLTALACEPLEIARDVRAGDRLLVRAPDRLDRTILVAG